MIAELDRSGAAYVTQRGQARAVLISVSDYATLLEQLEYRDSLEVVRAAERRKHGESTRDMASVKRDVQKGAGQLQDRASAKR